MSIRIPGIWAAVVIGLLGAAVYWAGLPGGFFFDDGPSLLQAPGIRMTELSWESVQQAWGSGGAGPTGRPVAQLSFALNHLLSGFSPQPYKFTNLLIHGLAAVLVYLVVSRLLREATPSSTDKYAGWGAVVVAALWLLHPVQLLPVLHVVQRMTSLSALFLLAAFWLHMAGRARASRPGVLMLLLAWVVVWPLSVLSKETGLLFPLFILAWELLLRNSSAGHLDRFARAYLVAAVVLALGVLIYLLSAKSQWLWAGYEFRPFTLAQRLLTETRVLWFYVGLALLPRWSAFGVYHDDIAISTDVLTPWTTLPALLGVAALLLLIWRTRQRAPLIAFGIAWFLVGHLMESTFLPLEIAHEHRNYLPLLGILLAAAGLLLQAMERRAVAKKTGLVIAALALVYFSAMTALRAHQFGGDLRRTLVEAQHHPDSAAAQLDAGQALAGLPVAAEAGSTIHAAARAYYERATLLNPNFKLALLHLLALDCKAGLPVRPAEIDELSRRLRATLFAPADRSVLYYLKEMAITGPRCLTRAEVEGLFDAAVANPGVGPHNQAMLYSWRADYLWLRERDLPAAKDALHKSLTLNPSNPSNRLKWAQLLWIGGDRQGARSLLLDLRGQVLSAEEHNTINELLAPGNITQP